MEKWIEATGRTEDAAVQNALAQLGLDRDSVSVEILERARSGFFRHRRLPGKKSRSPMKCLTRPPRPSRRRPFLPPRKKRPPKRNPNRR